MKKYNQLKFITFIFFTCCMLLRAFGEFSFHDFDLNSNGDILFSLGTESNGQKFTTLFLKHKDSENLEQLTFFPELLNSFQNGNILKISNRFGSININTITGNIKAEKLQTQFSTNSTKYGNTLCSMQSSPDGRWTTIIRPKTSIRGDLVLYDSYTDKEYIIAKNIPTNANPIVWSDDSSGFVYEANSSLYFARPSWFSKNRKIETDCLIGKGNISAIKWISNSQFLFISGNSILKINATEILTRTLYSPIITIGTLVGNLPFEFNSINDKLFISNSGNSMVFIRNNRHIYFFNQNLYDLNNEKNNIPYLLLPSTNASTKVFWNKEEPIISTSGIKQGKQFFKSWKANNSKFTEMKLAIDNEIIGISPSGNMLAVKNKDELKILNLQTNSEISKYNIGGIISCSWPGNNTLFVGNATGVFKINIKEHSIKTLLHSQVKDFSWNLTGNKIIAKTNNLKTDEIIEYTNNGKWVKSKETKLNDKKNYNTTTRLYINSGFGKFDNMLFIRQLNPVHTESLFVKSEYETQKYNRKKEITDKIDGVFYHGNRDKNKIAIIFDIMKNTDGVSEVLYILNKYNIKATFFINGEAIRTNAVTLKEIVNAGHSCGSMFFSTWNLSDTNYRIDKDFIKNGLARNEDIFYNAVNSELSLLWHSPYYILSPTIIEAGKEAGYTFVLPDLQIPDWITNTNRQDVPALYKTSLNMIDDILQNAGNGSIIPIQLGKTSPPRSEYLYSSLELLIRALLDEGYKITTVEELMNTK